MNPLPVALSMIRRNRVTSVLFIFIIAIAVALGVAISAQERALRQGTARAADGFDLIVAAPGSLNDLLFSVVYLQQTAVDLLPAEVTARLMAEPRAEFVAPIGFGDEVQGHPVIGTIAPFVAHLSGRSAVATEGAELAEGRHFTAMSEAVVGALVPFALGETLVVGHGGGDADTAADEIEGTAEGHDHVNEHDDGHGHDHDDHAHGDHSDDNPPHGAEGHVHSEGDEGGGQAIHDSPDADEAGHGHEGEHPDLTVVGRMHPTGTPWDRAVIVPVEYSWHAHGLETGHAPGDARIGPPYSPQHLPGLPAVVVKPADVAAAYGLRGAYRGAGSTAFFPAEVLVQLYAVLGDAAGVMSLLTLAALALVMAAIMVGLVAVLDLQRRSFALLRALGASRIYVLLTVWSHAAILILTGAVLGLGLGYGMAVLATHLFSQGMGIAMTARIGTTELTMVLAVTLAGVALAALPALAIFRRQVVEALR